MRTLIATVFNYSLDGLMADQDTDFWTFCFDQPENRNPDDAEQLEFLRSADAHLMGRTTYEGTYPAMTSRPDHPMAPILNEGRKVVFSKTMTSADWANTTIASGDTRQEVEALRQGGDGHMIVWGGTGLFRSLMQLDLIDEVHVSLFPYIAGTGTRLWDGVPSSYALELTSSDASRSGIVELRYRRPR